MEKQERRKGIKNLCFDDASIDLALTIVDKVEKPLELLFYLMRRENQRAMVLMLISANNIDMDAFLQEKKRDTDILYKVDETRNIYAMICQDTRVDEGYHFAQRLHRSLEELGAEEAYVSEVEISSTNYEAKEVIFRLIELYFTAANSGQTGEINFYAFS